MKTSLIVFLLVSLLVLSVLAGCASNSSGSRNYYRGYYSSGLAWRNHGSFIVNRPIYIGIPDPGVDPDFGVDPGPGVDPGFGVDPDFGVDIDMPIAEPF